ncbi:MAG: ROK family protein, partial [Terriglobia bacterium]
MELSFPRPGQMTEWKNIPLQAILEEEFSLPCMIEDSVRPAALAEKHHGICASLDDFLYIMVGMGIGAAISINGRLYEGGGGGAGEFGHITIDENGPLCSCGNNGCLEALASCSAIIQAVRKALEKGVDTKVMEIAGGNLGSINIESIAQAASANDAMALRVLHDAISHVGVALADVVNLLNPATVVFGGSLARSAPDLVLGVVSRVIKQRALEKAAGDAQLKISTLGSEDAALGAVRLISE